MDTEKEEMHSKNFMSYLRNFDYKGELTQLNDNIGSIVFVKKEYHPKDEPRKNNPPIATGPHEVTAVSYKTCIVLIEENDTERISLYLVVQAPQF